MSSESSVTRDLAVICGYLSTTCFFVQYIPQAVMNWKRKSVSGFSTTSILIKLIGASFFFANSTLSEETFSTILYGFINVLQHLVFMIQFTIFTGSKSFILWCLFPLAPLLTGLYFPETIATTNVVKPICQVASHIPQLWVSFKQKTTKGVSPMSQHLNFIGGALGMYLYILFPPKSNMTYLVYLNSIFQAASIYAMTIYYDGWKEFLSGFSPSVKGNELKHNEEKDDKKIDP